MIENKIKPKLNACYCSLINIYYRMCYLVTTCILTIWAEKSYNTVRVIQGRVEFIIVTGFW